MKPTQTLICTLAMGAMIFVTSNVFAVQGTLTISGTALSQTQDKNNNYTATKISLNQKNLLFLLAQATGDTSITNSKTIIIYDPDAHNENAAISNQGYDFYGVFFYSNSVAGLKPLDGVDDGGNYMSYIELDYINFVTRHVEGFWNYNGVESNNIFVQSKNKLTGNGNGILYVHSNPYFYDLPDGNLYFANGSISTYNQYALVFHGQVQFIQSSNGTTTQQSFTIGGSGDGEWDFADIDVSGKAKFSAK